MPVSQSKVFAQLLRFLQQSPAMAPTGTLNTPWGIQRVAFESFRDLVKLMRKGLSDAAGLAYVANESLDIRAKARAKANLSAGVKQQAAATAPGIQLPRAVAMAEQSSAEPAGADVSVEAQEDMYEGQDAAEDDMIEAAEDDATALDAVALHCGIKQFTAELQRAVVQEEEASEDKFAKRSAASLVTALALPARISFQHHLPACRKPRLSRRKMAMKVKRMLGEGRNPFGKPRAWFKEAALHNGSVGAWCDPCALHGTFARA
jgi:hypothetical protein